MVESSLGSEPMVVTNGGSYKTARTFVVHAFLTALATAVPLPPLVPIVVLHGGMRMRRSVAWLSAAAGVALAALWVAYEISSGALPRAEYSYLLWMIIGVAVPSMIVLPMVQRGETLGRVLFVVLIASTAALLVTEGLSRVLLQFSPYLDQVANAKRIGASVAEIYAKMGIPPAAAKKWIDVVLYCVPASVIINVAASFILGLIILARVREWNDVVEDPAGPFRFRNLAFPDWLLFAFIAGGLTPLLKGLAQQVSANVLAVVVFLYFVQGLAIVRSLLTTFGAGVVMSLFAWGLLLFLTPGGIAPLLLAITGLFDSFFDFRHFFKRKDHPDESDFD